MTTSESDKIRAIETFVLTDLGFRGFPRFYENGLYRRAAESLLSARSVWLTSGFWILSAGAIETDGPPGTAVLAGALEQLGIPVRILTDGHSVDIFRDVCTQIGFKGEITDIDSLSVNSLTAADYPSHFVALERPGKSVDGLYYNFRGISISEYTADADSLFEAAEKAGSVTIGIGDGGNELGMGNYRKRVEKELVCDRPFAATVGSAYPLCAGVSNWGGYALAGILSVLTGKELMPQSSAVDALLKRCVENGCVDGVSGKPEASVDGLRDNTDAVIFEMIRSVVKQ